MALLSLLVHDIKGIGTGSSLFFVSRSLLVEETVVDDEMSSSVKTILVVLTTSSWISSKTCSSSASKEGSKVMNLAFVWPSSYSMTLTEGFNDDKKVEDTEEYLVGIMEAIEVEAKSLGDVEAAGLSILLSGRVGKAGIEVVVVVLCC